MSEIQIGSIVRICPYSRFYGLDPITNPDSSVEGEVVYISPGEEELLPISVRWPSGRNNSYSRSDLVVVGKEGITSKKYSFGKWIRKVAPL